MRQGEGQDAMLQRPREGMRADDARSCYRIMGHTNAQAGDYTLNLYTKITNC